MLSSKIASVFVLQTGESRSAMSSASVFWGSAAWEEGDYGLGGPQKENILSITRKKNKEN